MWHCVSSSVVRKLLCVSPSVLRKLHCISSSVLRMLHAFSQPVCSPEVACILSARLFSVSCMHFVSPSVLRKLHCQLSVLRKLHFVSPSLDVAVNWSEFHICVRLQVQELFHDGVLPLPHRPAGKCSITSVRHVMQRSLTPLRTTCGVIIRPCKLKFFIFTT